MTIYSLLSCEKKCYLQVYLDERVYKIVKKQMIIYLNYYFYGIANE